MTVEAIEGVQSPSVLFVYHRGYRESKAVKDALDKEKVTYRARDVYELPLKRDELLALLDGQSDTMKFLNERATEFRDRGLEKRIPTHELAAELMERDPTLLQVPILIRGDDVCVARTPDDALEFLGLKKAPAAKKPAKAAPAKKPEAKADAAAKPEAAAKEAAKKDAPEASAKEPAAKEST